MFSRIISGCAFLFLINTATSAQNIFDQPNFQSVGVKVGLVDVRGEIASRLDGFYIGTEVGLEYSSTFNFSALWHYYGEISYYSEEINPGGNTLHYLQGYSAQASGFSAAAGIKYYVFSNAEFLKIKYEENGGWSLLPYIAGGVGVTSSGIELINTSNNSDASTLNIPYEISEGNSINFFGEGTFGLDLYLSNNFKINGYASMRAGLADDWDGLIGSGPFPDVIVRSGIGFHWLF